MNKSFYRTEGDKFKITVMRDIDDILDDDGNVTSHPDFAELRHGDIVYNMAHKDYREYAFNAIRVYRGQKFVEGISSHNGIGVEIKTNITSRIANPVTFYENLANYKPHKIDELFIMLDSKAHKGFIYNYSSMTDSEIDQHKFFWWQNLGELAIINCNGSIEEKGRRVDGEYGNIFVDYKPSTAEMLYTMSRDGDLDGVTKLIEKGVKPDIISNENHPKTACWIATYRRHNDILRVLLENGADPNFEQEGVVPLYFAIAFQNLEAVKLLVDHGASLTQTDKKGHTPLYYANNNECKDIIDYVTPPQIQVA